MGRATQAHHTHREPERARPEFPTAGTELSPATRRGRTERARAQFGLTMKGKPNGGLDCHPGDLGVVRSPVCIALCCSWALGPVAAAGRVLASVPRRIAGQQCLTSAVGELRRGGGRRRRDRRSPVRNGPSERSCVTSVTSAPPLQGGAAVRTQVVRRARRGCAAATRRTGSCGRCGSASSGVVARRRGLSARPSP